MSILQRINGHDDLVALSNEERKQLCGEIRGFLVEHVAKTGGHLASNLGVVELTVAIETVFHTAKDRLVFDVGHQSYVHKLLTGRQADFEHLRQLGGMAGFPKPGESIADAFVAGHASSSVSIALGMARARSLMNEDYQVVALLGDGAATGGMVYEALNDAAQSDEPMIVVLNDNGMSIDPNVGGMAMHLSQLRTQESYLDMKKWYRKVMYKVPGGELVYKFTRAVKDWVKRSLIPTTIFENMGFTYLGPVDGHDIQALITLLRTARDMDRPVLIHVITKKGLGYEPAEKDPAAFHGVGKFDAKTGKLPEKNPTFSDSFGDIMVELARKNPRVCAITAAMPGGTGLLGFKENFPERLFDVGIAEEHAVSMAGGLAKQGMIPVVAIYSTFLQRSYDQIMQDAAMLGLHVVFAVDRAGLVGEDGETHHGVYDVGYLRHAPGMTVLCPANTAELKAMMRWAVEDCTGPVAVRYPRGGDGKYIGSGWNAESNVVSLRQGNDFAVVTYGTLVNQALDAADILEREDIHISVIQLTKILPLPTAALDQALKGHKRILLAEETAAAAGIHESISMELYKRIPDVNIYLANLGERYVTHGSISELYRIHGLDAASIAAKIREVLKVEN